MDDLSLREFIDLAKTLNFQESADNMCISASALSKHIKKVEEELGVPLFNRSTRTVSLTQYGSILQEYAEKIIKLHDSCARDIRDAQTSDEGQINIGFLSSLGRFGILEILSGFSRQYPYIALNISESREVEKYLLENKFDFIFCDSFGISHSDIRKILIEKDHAVAVLPPKHPLAGEKQIVLTQLQNDSFIIEGYSVSKPTLSSQKILNMCQRTAGFTPKVSMITKHISTIAAMVEHGRGVSVMNSLEIFSEQLHHQCAIVDIFPDIPLNQIAHAVR